MTGERPILIVDDDEALRATLVEQLSLEGEFTAIEASDVAEAEGRLARRDVRFDAIILDVGLPDGDGRDLCARWRRQGVKVPIVILTGSDEESDVVRGLDSGANDYIASRSASPSCWRGCARNCASSRTARTRSSPSGPTSSSLRPRSCVSPPRTAASG